MVTAADTALPAIASLFRVFSAVRKLPNFRDNIEYRYEAKKGLKVTTGFPFYSLLLRRVPIVRECDFHFFEIMENVCIFRNWKLVIDPLLLITLINTPDKALIESAIMASRLMYGSLDWKSAIAKVMIKACVFDSNNTVASLLNQAFSSSFGYSNIRALLYMQDDAGRSLFHSAVDSYSFRVIKELLKSEELDTRSSKKEIHGSGGNEIVSDDDQTGLLYLPDVFGNLPIHLAANDPFNEDNGAMIELLIEYDANTQSYLRLRHPINLGLLAPLENRPACFSHTTATASYLFISLRRGISQAYGQCFSVSLRPSNIMHRHSCQAAIVTITGSVAACYSLAHGISSFQFITHFGGTTSPGWKAGWSLRQCSSLRKSG